LEQALKYLEIRPFGPPILKFKIPQNIVDELNEFIDTESDIILNEELDHSEHLVGKVTSELLFPQFLFTNNNNWNFFSTAIDAYISAHDSWCDTQHADNCDHTIYYRETEYFQALIQSAWFVRSYAGDYNPVHTHPGVAIASVGYLKLPDWEDEMKEDAEDHAGRMAGCLQFSYGPGGMFARSTYVAEPEVGDFYLFPAWLAHTAYPFQSIGERRSFAINFDLSLTQRTTNLTEND
jgi:hypothetical protein